MKRMMTKEQIDEVNELLVDHGETLTAFYDEGRTEIMLECCKAILIAMPIIFIVDRSITYINKRRKSQKESES